MIPANPYAGVFMKFTNSDPEINVLAAYDEEEGVHIRFEFLCSCGLHTMLIKDRWFGCEHCDSVCYEHICEYCDQLYSLDLGGDDGNV